MLKVNNACFASHTVISAITELEPPLTLNEISDAQLEDRTLQQFRDEDAHDRETVDWTLSTLLRHINNIFEDGILYIADDEHCRIILRPSLHATVLYEMHNTPMAGHQGVQCVCVVLKLLSLCSLHLNLPLDLFLIITI